jgi:ferredoxin
MAVKKYEGAVTIEIDDDKCNGDGECVNVCPTKAIKHNSC